MSFERSDINYSEVYCKCLSPPVPLKLSYYFEMVTDLLFKYRFRFFFPKEKLSVVLTFFFLTFYCSPKGNPQTKVGHEPDVLRNNNNNNNNKNLNYPLTLPIRQAFHVDLDLNNNTACVGCDCMAGSRDLVGFIKGQGWPRHKPNQAETLRSPLMVDGACKTSSINQSINQAKI